MNVIDELILLTNLEETLALLQKERIYRTGLVEVENRIKNAIKFVMEK